MADDSWAQCLSALKGRLQKQSYETWLQPLRCTRFDDYEVVLEAPNSFALSWVQEHYLDGIRTVIARLFNGTPKVSLILGRDEDASSQIEIWQEHSREADPPDVERGEDHSAAAYRSKEELPPPGTQNGPARVSGHSRPRGADDPGNGSGELVGGALSPEFRFESYVAGPQNEMAYVAAEEIARQPGQPAYNPLLIYGGVGLGKTHLLQAIAHRGLRHPERPRVLYVTSEQFVRDFVSCMKRNQTLQFAKRYRQVDVLLLDDIQFFQGKQQMQEEFFHTFNTLHNQGKQVVLASDRAPETMKDMQDRIVSRIQWGLVADLQNPGVETRTAICQKKAEVFGLDLPFEFASYIAEHVTTNVRNLEGVVRKLAFLLKKMNMRLTMSVVEKAVGRRRAAEAAPITAQSIQEAVAGYYRLPSAALPGKSRRADIVARRQLAMHLCKLLTGDSLRAIGASFGGRNHATVLHSLRKFEELARADDRLRAEANAIARSLGGELPFPELDG